MQSSLKNLRKTEISVSRDFLPLFYSSGFYPETKKQGLSFVYLCVINLQSSTLVCMEENVWRQEVSVAFRSPCHLQRDDHYYGYCNLIEPFLYCMEIL